MSYTPEPTHPFNEGDLPPQLNREFWALFNNDLQLKDFITGALPIKAFNIIMDGAGSVGDPNLVVPTIRSSYNIDRSVGTDGVVRVGVGAYQFKMRVPVIAGESILDQTYPAFVFSVVFPANAVTRAGPTRTSFDESFSLTAVDVTTGVFDIETEHIYSTGGGILSVELTDMQPGDVFFASGTISLISNAGDFPTTP